MKSRVILALAAATLAACAKPEQQAAPPAERPSILLVTLDTTRFDAIGAATPSFNALAQRGRVFTQAYATAPQTLPSHASMMTGLYPGGHRVHENGRTLSPTQPLLAERLNAAGYRTAAFVSAFTLARQFGLARGFQTYDDQFPVRSPERSSALTTDRAIAWLQQDAAQPSFLWVHYFDPHAPYEPPRPFDGDHYRGEVAEMDRNLGRLIHAFEARGTQRVIIVAADHGEALGEHGESQHGNLLYQGVMHVPLVLIAPGVEAGTFEQPVSTRRVHHTILAFSGTEAGLSLAASHKEVVMGEAMMPFLQYGWQPQVMAVEDRTKVIHAGAIEAYDLRADPQETRSLGDSADLSRELRRAIREYPLPSLQPPPATSELTAEEQRKLASLGYVSSNVAPTVRADAPRPADMAHLFEPLERASALFTAGQFEQAIPVLEAILRSDRNNVSTALRLAVAHSSLGHDRKALEAFRLAETTAPGSPDVRHYLALHYARTGQWREAEPLLERTVSESPDRLPALEALATLRERQNRLPEAAALRERISAMRLPSRQELEHLGRLQMAVGNTEGAIASFEKARSADRLTSEAPPFLHDLELGVLYLSARKLDQAREALDRALARDPRNAMALFKRAQVAVLLREPDATERIKAAKDGADATTRVLIGRERLFQ